MAADYGLLGKVVVVVVGGEGVVVGIG